MKKLMDVLPLLLVVVLLFGTACQSNKKKDAESARSRRWSTENGNW